MSEPTASAFMRLTRRGWILGVVAVLAAAVRLPGAIHDAFWEDEIASARIIIQPTFPDMLRTVRATEATPPLWYAMGWAFHEVGLSPYGYRFLDLAFAALLAVATYALARRLLESAPAFAATLVVIGGYQFVFHGRELRAYELYALLTVVFALALLRATEKPGFGRLAVLAAAVAAGSLTNYFFLLFLACGALWLWLSESGRTRRRAGLALLVGFLAFLPWAPAVLTQYGHHHFSFIGPFRASKVISAYWLLVAKVDPATPVLHWLAPIVTFALVVISAAALGRRPGAARLIAMLAVLPVFIAAAVWIVGPQVFDVRNALGAGPFAAVCVTALITRLPVRLAGAIGVAALALLAYGCVTEEATPPTDYQAIAHALVGEGWSTHSPILLYHGNFFAFRGPLEWYLPGQPGLTLAVPARRKCRVAYAVIVGSPNRKRLERRFHWTAARTIGNVTVARLPVPVRLPRARLKAVHIVTTTDGHSSCVHPLSEKQLRHTVAP